MPNTETTAPNITVKVDAGPIALGLTAIAFAILAPLDCNHEARCAKWIDAAPSVQERIDRTAQCDAEDAAR